MVTRYITENDKIYRTGNATEHSYRNNKEQFNRYRQSLNNLILTDYLTFRYYVDGYQTLSVTIAHENKGIITPEKGNYNSFIELGCVHAKEKGQSNR
jgi:hypothetical protein